MACSTDSPRTGERIAYIASQFPTLRETFIIREILELERRGVEVAVYSLKPPQDDLPHGDLQNLKAAVYYAPHLGGAGLILDNLRTFRERPLQYLSLGAGQAWAFRRYPMQALKALLLFPKMVHYARHMKRSGFEHANACWANFPAAVAMIARRFFGVRYCMTCHAWDIFVPMNQAGLGEKIAAANGVRAISDFNVRLLESFCRTADDKGKILRNYIGVDVGRYRVRPAPKTDRFVIASGGSLIEQKGLNYLLDAMAALRQSGVSCHAKIVGDGDLRQPLLAQIGRLDLGDCVEMPGVMSNEAFLDLIANSSAFVLPCVQAPDGRMDGIPTVLIEAMALGVPVISCAVSGLPELIEDGVSGLLTPTRDAPALAAAIRRLMNDRGLQQQLARSGRAKVERLFDIGRNVDQLVDLYRNWGVL